MRGDDTKLSPPDTAVRFHLLLVPVTFFLVLLLLCLVWFVLLVLFFWLLCLFLVAFPAFGSFFVLIERDQDIGLCNGPYQLFAAATAWPRVN